jgi:hypothetical protein
MWREGLLAMKVLRGETRGYRFHPQLDRFKAHQDPYGALTQFMHGILDESKARGYNFDATKLSPCTTKHVIPVTRGQVHFELDLVAEKLRRRGTVSRIPFHGGLQESLHPLFKLVDGNVESWEKAARVEDGRE